MKKMTTVQIDTTDPATREVVPGGGRVGYLPNGDLVEVVPGEDDEGKPIEWPMLLRATGTTFSKPTTNSGTKSGGTVTRTGSLR